MSRPQGKPLTRRRLIITYEISDDEQRMECRRMVSHELLDAMRTDVRGALLWFETDSVIREVEMAWTDKNEALANG